MITGALCRHARHAELSALAASQASALFGDDSLVLAYLQYSESESLACLGAASGAERLAYLRRSWEVLLSLVTLLLRRVAANTLLPGTIREEELDFNAHVQVAVRKATNTQFQASNDELRALSSAFGYDTLLNAMYRSLDFLGSPM